MDNEWIKVLLYASKYYVYIYIIYAVKMAQTAVLEVICLQRVVLRSIKRYQEAIGIGRHGHGTNPGMHRENRTIHRDSFWPKRFSKQSL